MTSIPERISLHCCAFQYIWSSLLRLPGLFSRRVACTVYLYVSLHSSQSSRDQEMSPSRGIGSGGFTFREVPNVDFLLFFEKKSLIWTAASPGSMQSEIDGSSASLLRGL